MGTTPTRVQLFVRSDSAAVARERKGEVLDRLQTLREAGIDVETATWGHRIVIDDEERIDNEAIEQYERFRDWAEKEGASLYPAFRTRQYDCSFTGVCAEILVTPGLCLAVYDGDELTAVYPRWQDDRTLTVEDGLAALAEAVGADTTETATTPPA
ncbi:HTH domain-containing protein [Natronomonas sp. EA1]|uniref:HTH domain-containing protein n=1 Tax=Natronomonas sp. EA1 TaxID=3421655 RepID=UPI003EB753EE